MPILAFLCAQVLVYLTGACSAACLFLFSLLLGCEVPCPSGCIVLKCIVHFQPAPLGNLHRFQILPS